MLQSMGPFAHWADMKARKKEDAVMPSKEDDYNGRGQYDGSGRTRYRPHPCTCWPVWLAAAWPAIHARHALNTDTPNPHFPSPQFTFR